jgi:hypothetical protein
MKRKKLIIILSSIILLILIISIVNSQITGNSVNSNNPQGEQITVTRDTLPLYLKTLEIVKDLPKKGVIGFSFYDYSTGERVITHKYLLTKGEAELKDYTNENPDIIVSVHTRYFSQLGDFCGAVKAAKSNDDLAIDLKISTSTLLWKYKGMMKYKDCLGY